MAKLKDISGQRFGRLVVREFKGRNRHGQVLFLCDCDCGAQAILPKHRLTTGHTLSCGCFRVDAARERATTHGMRNTPEWLAWNNMVRRCTDPRATGWCWYGAEGIAVCDEWLNNFEAFHRHIGRKPSNEHSLDRIDCRGNYEPGNVRWATKVQQSNNTRNNLLIQIGGRILTLAQAARITGVNYQTAYYRYCQGWSAEKVLAP